MKHADLAKLAGPSRDVPEPNLGRDGWMIYPFVVEDGEGTPWTVTTDRVWFVAIGGKGSYGECQASEDALLSVKRLVGIEPPAKTQKVRIEDICEYERVRVCDVPIDAERFKWLGPLLPAEVDVWDASKQAGLLCLGMAGKGWLVLLAGKPGTNIPVFGEQKQQNAFEEAMSLVDED